MIKDLILRTRVIMRNMEWNSETTAREDYFTIVKLARWSPSVFKVFHKNIEVGKAKTLEKAVDLVGNLTSKKI